METRIYRHSRTSKGFKVMWFVGLFVLSQVGFWHSVRVSDRSGIAVCAIMGLMFAGLTFLGLRLGSSRPYLTLSSEGIHVAPPGLPLIPWSDVKALYRRDLTTHSVVEIVLTPADKYERLSPRWKLSRIALEHTPEGPAVCVLITSLDAPADQVCREMQESFQNFTSKPSNKALQATAAAPGN
jgi:hypothetical protein